MLRYFNILFVLLSFTGTLRAATRPHAETALETNRTWTNEDLKRLSNVPGLISVVGQPADEAMQGVDATARPSRTEEPAWYAAQAASLRTRLEAEQADLREFTQALEDARDLNATTSGINLGEAGIGITPEDTIDILQNRIRITQSELDELEDLARHDDIPPGILLGQSHGITAETAVKATERSQGDGLTRGGDL